jgi:NAD(P)H dehydrogenase (quinone)
MSDTIFVTGASGQLGRAVIKHMLDSQGISPALIFAGTRSPEKLAELAAQGVNVREVDFDNQSAMEGAFAGAGTLLIISTDALDAAGTRLRQHKAAVAAAIKAGVGRIAYTSLPNAETSAVSFAPDHLGTENAIKASGRPYLIFRNSWYQENLLMSLPQALSSGRWYTSAGDGRTAFIARDDIAAAIAAALANPPAASKTYTFAGAEALSNDEIARLASSTLGKPIEVVHLTDEQLAEGMKSAGVPDAFIPTFVSFDRATRSGDLSTLTDSAEKLAGRKLQSVEAFIRENAAAFG